MAKKPVPVEEFLADLRHPLADDVDTVRDLIMSAVPELVEKIKWAAPSYSLDGVDLLTFNLRPQDKIHLVLHHPRTPEVESDLLEGAYADGRRMAYFHSSDEVDERADELRRVVRELATLARA